MYMIYFICDNNLLHFFIDYIGSIQSNYNNIKIIQNIHEIEHMDYNSKYIFVQRLRDISQEIMNDYDFYLLNTEQLSKREWVDYLLGVNIKIIDYSMANIQCLLPYISRPLYYLPYMVNKNEIYNYEKIYDIAVIGHWTDSYRMNITDNIPNINIIEGYGLERDERLFKHKILLNVHFNERFKIFEQMRCNRCILNKMIIITEKSLDIDYELKEYMIECEYGDLVSTTQTVLENYEYYYNKLFENFDIEKIEKMYKKLGDEVIDI